MIFYTYKLRLYEYEYEYEYELRYYIDINKGILRM